MDLIWKPGNQEGFLVSQILIRNPGNQEGFQIRNAFSWIRGFQIPLPLTTLN
jgi:hypothetical protein